MARYAERIRRDPRLRHEVAWVVARRLADSVLAFCGLKILTRLLGQEGFGEFRLALTALVLLANFLIMPMNQAYLRGFHTAKADGSARAAGLTLIRWYATATLAVAILASLLTRPLSHAFGLHAWTALAAGMVFLCNQWRTLSIEVLDIQRRRAACGLLNIGFQALQLTLIVLAVYAFHASPAVALMAYALAAAVFALIGALPLVRWILSQPPGVPSGLGRLVLTFGVPYAVLLVFQWAQNYGDRYILGIHLDFRAVGIYVACYQVCGIPHQLLIGFWNIFIAVAYQRARDVSDPRQLWSADRLLLLGMSLYVTAGALMVVVYAFLGQLFVTLLTDATYVLPRVVLVSIATVRFLSYLLMALQLFFTTHQRMQTLLAFRILSGLMTIGFTWFAVARYGIPGAAYGTLAAVCASVLLYVVGPGGVLWMVRRARRGAQRAVASDPKDGGPC